MSHNVDMPIVTKHSVLREDSSLILIDCIIVPRYIECFGLKSVIKKIHDETCIIKKFLIKCIPRNKIKQLAEITNVWLIDALHPNANVIQKEFSFEKRVLDEISEYVTCPTKQTYDMFKFCKDPYLSYAGDQINISISKLANDLSFWNFDEGYWSDISKISIDIGDVDEVYDHKQKKMISVKKAKRRLMAGKFLNMIKKPLSSLTDESEKHCVHTGISVLQNIKLI